jgi:predicted dinucleotide-binding enzyme
MKIGFIGSGNVGGALGKAWAAKGHQIYFSSRNPGKPEMQTLAREAGPTAISTDIKSAVDSADILVLATPWDAAQSALSSAGDLHGKILIDTTNPLLPGLAGLAAGTTTSGGELVATWAPGARVVKAFNTVGFNIMADSAFPQGKPALFYCGDDADAKHTVSTLVTELGFDALDAGPLTQTRVLEPFALLWISLALKYGYTRDIAFQLMRR